MFICRTSCYDTEIGRILGNNRKVTRILLRVSRSLLNIPTHLIVGQVWNKVATLPDVFGWRLSDPTTL